MGVFFSVTPKIKNFLILTSRTQKLDFIFLNLFPLEKIPKVEKEALFRLQCY